MRLALPLAALLAVQACEASATETKKAPPLPVVNQKSSVPDAWRTETDLRHAVPLQDIGKLPSTEEQLRALNKEVGREKPLVANAKAQSDALHREAALLRQRLIDTAARVQALEAEGVRLDGEIARLSRQYQALSESFVEDRASVARLLVVLERVQHDEPPAIVLKPDDALGAARGAMLIGASLPEIYGEAASLARRITLLKETRQTLAARRTDSAVNAERLTVARTDLNQLLATKEIAARAAEGEYGELRTRLDAIAARAGDLQSLLTRVAVLRAQPAPQDLVVVTPKKGPQNGRKGSFLKPVVGELTASQVEGSPGITFATEAGAEVVSPADGKVLFSGLYHKYGHVLIVETTLGYDAVLAGLDHVNVRPEDHVLAGEPVGAMPNSNTGRLYFELRQNGRGIDPAPFLIFERKAKRT